MMNNLKRLTLLSITTLKRITSTHIRLFSDKVNPTESKAHLLMLTIPVASFGLGTWQVKRLQWKKGLINDLNDRTQHQVIPLPDDILDPGRIKELEYCRIFVEGKFDHSKEIFLGPRSLIVPGAKTGGGLVGPKSRSGYQIVTPFLLNSGKRILINRGWVSVEKLKPENRLEGQIEDYVNITGLLRVNENRPNFTPKVQKDSLQWHYRDVENFSEQLNTLPIFIDADSTCNVEGGPIGGQTNVYIRNEHMQYIITWYSLAAATLFMYWQFRKKPAAMFKNGPVNKPY